MKKILFGFVVLLLGAGTQAQEILGYRSESESEFPVVTWYSKALDDSLSFNVYRAAHGSNEFIEIHPRVNKGFMADTLFFSMMDTTLTEKNIWQYYIRGEDRDGVSSASEVMMAHNLGYIPPPQIYNVLVSPSADQKAVRLSWQLRNPQTVVGINLFRSRNYDDGYQLVTRLPSDTREYTDPVSRANEPWYYFFMIQDYFGYQPPSARIHGFATYAEKPIPPQDFTVSILNDSIQFSWRKVGDNIFNYRIYSRTNQQGSFFPVSAPFFIPGDKITKRDRMVVDSLATALEFYCTSISDGYIESNPGDTVILLFPRNMPVFPPPHVDYVPNEEGAITLFWPLPDDGTLMAYNIYRHQADGNPEKLNGEPVMENSWQDKPPVYKGEVIYEIESINAGGKASAYRTQITVNRSISQRHLVISSRQVGNGLQLEWLPLASRSIKSLKIYRQTDGEEPALLIQVDPSTTTYTDTSVETGQAYIYYFIGEEDNGTPVLLNEGIVGIRH